ncbi:hypothetical protein KP79_PYT08733 [Mizuhopecten yessoensis]|uniref:Uncharacterized protein n=1 Tax=Mizuhopecten yessoensis TaxID=6573 RepID=A0A210QJJ0_MIZYE|nr:hypothetical protein KP79_PYT08733 [Mizuhopecten yessoensis]
MGKTKSPKMNRIEERITNLDLLDGIARKRDKQISKICDSEPDLEEDGLTDDYPDFPRGYRPRSLSEGKLESDSSEKSKLSVTDTLIVEEPSGTGESKTNTNSEKERKPVTRIRYRTRRASHYHVQWAGETVITPAEEGEEEKDVPRQRSYSDASHQRVKPRSILKYPRQEKPTCVVFVHAD